MSERDMLRRLVGTIVYRAEVAFEGASERYWTFGAGADARTPSEILRHVTNLLSWTCELLGGERFPRAENAAGPEAIERLRACARHLDGIVVAADLERCDVGTALQGPLADALSHVGQLALLRRLAGEPLGRQGYSTADVRLDRSVPEAP